MCSDGVVSFCTLCFSCRRLIFFFFNDTATTEIYTLSLHDALPISRREEHVTPIARELLAPSLDAFGRSSTLPAAAYTDASVFRWEQERFFDRGWVCAGRAGGGDEGGNQRVGGGEGGGFAHVTGEAPPF